MEALDRSRIPRHISCIMDGNGRWATARGMNRGEGHKAGIVSLREIITACVRLGVEVLSAYAFSTENWKRPAAEVNLLMHLFAQTFVDELPLLKRENVRVVFLGDLSALPKRTRDVFEYGLAETSGHTGMVLALAVNYGARAELARAARLLAQDALAGKIDPCDIDENAVASRLYTAGLPDPSSSSALRVSSGFRTTCFGRLLIPSFTLRGPIGRISTDGSSSTPSWRSRVATVASEGSIIARCRRW